MSYKEPISTSTQQGLVKPGTGLTIDPDGTLNVASIATFPGYHGEFYSETTQTNPVEDAVNIMRFEVSAVTFGVSMVANTRCTFANAGTYDVQFSAILAKPAGSAVEVDIWIRQNGVDVPWSNTVVAVQGNDAQTVASWNFLVPAAPGDYIEFAWSCSDDTLAIVARPPQTGPVRPGTPSTVLTAVQISA